MADRPFDVAVYVDGREFTSFSILPGTATHDEVVAWGRLHRSGWRRSIVTYAPGILLRAEDFTLNIQAGQVILNKDGVQVVRKIDPEAYVSLQAIILNKKKNQPNKAMETTPANVTIPADAGLAPFTSVSHL